MNSNLNTFYIDTGDDDQITFLNEKSHFEYKLKSTITILNGHAREYKLTVIDGFIPYTYYNITTTNNEITVLESNESGSLPQPAFTITIPVGNYQTLYTDSETRLTNELCYAIQTLLNSNTAYGITYLVVLNAINHKIEISTVTLDKKAVFTLTASSPHRILGSAIGSYSMTTTTDLTFSSVANLYPRKTLSIQTNLIIKNEASNLLLSINPTVRPYAFITIPRTEMFLADNRIEKLEFKLMNVDNELINLNNSDWYIVIKIEEVLRKRETQMIRQMSNEIELMFSKQTDDLITGLANFAELLLESKKKNKNKVKIKKNET